MNHQKGEWLLITLPGLLNITLYGCHLYGYVVQGIRKKSKLVWQVFIIPVGFLRWLLLFRHPIIVYLYFKSTVSNQSSLGHFFVLIVSSSYIVINSLNFVRDPSRTCLFFLHSALFRQPFRQSSLWYSVQVLLPILNLENWFSFRINVNFITLVYDHFISISWPRQWCVILARWIFVFILLKRFAIAIVSIANTCLPYKGQVELIRA